MDRLESGRWYGVCSRMADSKEVGHENAHRRLITTLLRRTREVNAEVHLGPAFPVVLVRELHNFFIGHLTRELAKFHVCRAVDVQKKVDVLPNVVLFHGK